MGRRPGGGTLSAGASGTNQGTGARGTCRIAAVSAGGKTREEPVRSAGAGAEGTAGDAEACKRSDRRGRTESTERSTEAPDASTKDVGAEGTRAAAAGAAAGAAEAPGTNAARRSERRRLLPGATETCEAGKVPWDPAEGTLGAATAGGPAGVAAGTAAEPSARGRPRPRDGVAGEGASDEAAAGKSCTFPDTAAGTTSEPVGATAGAGAGAQGTMGRAATGARADADAGSEESPPEEEGRTKADTAPGSEAPGDGTEKSRQAAQCHSASGTRRRPAHFRCATAGHVEQQRRSRPTRRGEQRPQSRECAGGARAAEAGATAGRGAGNGTAKAAAGAAAALSRTGSRSNSAGAAAGAAGA